MRTSTTSKWVRDALAWIFKRILPSLNKYTNFCTGASAGKLKWFKYGWWRSTYLWYSSQRERFTILQFRWETNLQSAALRKLSINHFTEHLFFAGARSSSKQRLSSSRSQSSARGGQALRALARSLDVADEISSDDEPSTSVSPRYVSLKTKNSLLKQVLTSSLLFADGLPQRRHQVPRGG